MLPAHEAGPDLAGRIARRRGVRLFAQRQFRTSRVHHQRARNQCRTCVRTIDAAGEAESGRPRAGAQRYQEPALPADRCRHSVRGRAARAIHQGNLVPAGAQAGMMDAALHGWSGIALAYAAVQGPMIAGLIRARARFHQYAISPIAALPIMGVVAVGSSLFARHGAVHSILALAASAWLGHAGGRVLAQGAAADRVHQRGSLIEERSPTPADKRALAGHASARGAGIYLAGVSGPPEVRSHTLQSMCTNAHG